MDMMDISTSCISIISIIASELITVKETINLLFSNRLESGNPEIGFRHYGIII